MYFYFFRKKLNETKSICLHKVEKNLFTFLKESMIQQIGRTINPIVHGNRVRFSSEELYYSIINPDDDPRHTICVPSSPVKTNNNSDGNPWILLSYLVKKIVFRKRNRISPIHTVPEHIFLPNTSH